MVGCLSIVSRAHTAGRQAGRHEPSGAHAWACVPGGAGGVDVHGPGEAGDAVEQRAEGLIFCVCLWGWLVKGAGVMGIFAGRHVKHRQTDWRSHRHSPCPPFPYNQPTNTPPNTLLPCAAGRPATRPAAPRAARAWPDRPCCGITPIHPSICLSIYLSLSIFRPPKKVSYPPVSSNPPPQKRPKFTHLPGDHQRLRQSRALRSSHACSSGECARAGSSLKMRHRLVLVCLVKG